MRIAPGNRLASDSYRPVYIDRSDNFAYPSETNTNKEARLACEYAGRPCTGSYKLILGRCYRIRGAKVSEMTAQRFQDYCQGGGKYPSVTTSKPFAGSDKVCRENILKCLKTYVHCFF